MKISIKNMKNSGIIISLICLGVIFACDYDPVDLGSGTT